MSSPAPALAVARVTYYPMRMTKYEFKMASRRHVQRLGPIGFAGGVEGDLLDALLGRAQQLLAAPLERFAAFVDRHRFLERHLALFEPLDDSLEFLDGALERQ